MKKLSLTAASVALALGLIGCSEQPQTQQQVEQPKTQEVTLSSGIELSNIDKSVRPQDDFYYHVNGHWLENTIIPADKSNYGSFTQLYDDSQKALRKVLEEAANNSTAKAGSDEQKLGAFYQSYMDEGARNELGLTPIKPYLSEIQALKSKSELPTIFAKMRLTGAHTPFGWYVNNDAKNSSENALYMFQSGLGLPDRDYYLKDDEKFTKIREQYQLYIEQLMAKTGHKNPALAALNILELEKQIAEAQWTRVESRDATKTYNKLTVEAFNKSMPDFDAAAFLRALGIKTDSLIVSQPSFF